MADSRIGAPPRPHVSERYCIMNRHLLTLLISLLAGCTATGDRYAALEADSGPQPGIVISCSGIQSWSDCHRKLARACPASHEWLAQEENYVTQGRSIRVRCKQES